MSTPEFIVADLAANRAALVEINVEYMSWVFREIDRMFDVDFAAQIGISAADYIPQVIDDICGQRPPQGIFYAVHVDNELAGMGGLCGIGPAQAEVKRLYIRPRFRGRKLGEQLLDRLLPDARSYGYRQVVLNSALFMKTAHRIYERRGFTDCAPYPGSEVPEAFIDRWRFMQRAV